MNMEKQIKIYALDNAVRYKGKASRGAVIGQVVNAYPEWKAKMKELQPMLNAVLEEVNAMTAFEQSDLLRELAPELLEPKEKKVREGLKELNNALEGKVVLRFEPSPSGPMHIGHSYTGSLNVSYAHKYKGKLILRISDTNPDNIDPVSYELLPIDMAWLYGKDAFLVLQSDRLESYYSVGLTLIEKGHSYVCTCTGDEFRELVNRNESCPCRDLGETVQEDRWRKMHSSEGYVDGDAVVRIKTDLHHKNPALRDFPVFRINTNEHPRQGCKYRVWPLMNMAVAVDDHELGLTHVLRAKDHYDNTKRQMYIYNYMEWDVPEFMHIGMINFEGLKLSASGMRKDIESGVYSGWDDIRLPTLLALRRRGYQPGAFIKFAESIGLSMTDKRVPAGELFKNLDAFNRQLVEPTAKRYFFVANPKEIHVIGAPELDIELHLHPDHMHGGRLLHSHDEFLLDMEDVEQFENGKLYRLMDCCNFVNNNGEFTFDKTGIQGYRERGHKILHWLPVNDELVDVNLLMNDGTVVSGKGEPALDALDDGTIVQFERKGFARFDHREGDVLVFYWLHK
ncbi:MAG: glutamate--tRNA ligase [Candidatus Nanoarchaeia archaeon]